MVELGVVEQRYQAVLAVLNDDDSVVEVARRFGVTRQSVHRWLREYAARGLAGLVDQSPRPVSCPHQMPPEVEALIVELRRGIRVGVRRVCCSSSKLGAWSRCRAGRRCIAAWCAMA